jgi:hypothetical protein
MVANSELPTPVRVLSKMVTKGGASRLALSALKQEHSASQLGWVARITFQKSLHVLDSSAEGIVRIALCCAFRMIE